MKPQHNKAIFLLPYGGGSASSMLGLSKELQGIDVHAIESPGRGRRLSEKLLTNINAIVEDAYKIIAPQVNNYNEYYLFGHSMGSLIGFLLIRKAQANGIKLPTHFFASGCAGPSCLEIQKRHLLPSAAFRDMLREMGGFHEEILADDSIMEFYEPILRADFQALETYVYAASDPADVRITSFFGSDEGLTLQQVKNWEKETIHPVDVVEFPGTHFFILQYWKEIAKEVHARVFTPGAVQKQAAGKMD